MDRRIRAAALLVDGSRILLVCHRDERGEVWWVPPGGGLNRRDESVFDTVIREVFEETGLTITVSRIAYLREFREAAAETHHFEVFMPAETWSGELTLDHLDPADADYTMVQEVRWVAREELPGTTTWPEYLDEPAFWSDAARGFPEVRYLGSQRDER